MKTEKQIARGLDITVKNIQFFEGHDGYGLNCSLYYQGKLLCRVHDGAYGGEFEYREVKDRDKLEKLFEEVSKLPTEPSEYFPEGMQPNLDMIVEELCNHFDLQKRISREKKKGICIGDSWSDYMILRWKGWELPKLAKNPKGKAIIEKDLQKHKDSNILNMDYLQELNLT